MLYVLLLNLLLSPLQIQAATNPKPIDCKALYIEFIEKNQPTLDSAKLEDLRSRVKIGYTSEYSAALEKAEVVFGPTLETHILPSILARFFIKNKIVDREKIIKFWELVQASTKNGARAEKTHSDALVAIENMRELVKEFEWSDESNIVDELMEQYGTDALAYTQLSEAIQNIDPEKSALLAFVVADKFSNPSVDFMQSVVNEVPLELRRQARRAAANIKPDKVIAPVSTKSFHEIYAEKPLRMPTTVKTLPINPNLKQEVDDAIQKIDPKISKHEREKIRIRKIAQLAETQGMDLETYSYLLKKIYGMEYPNQGVSLKNEEEMLLRFPLLHHFDIVYFDRSRVVFDRLIVLIEGLSHVSGTKLNAGAIRGIRADAIKMLRKIYKNSGYYDSQKKGEQRLIFYINKKFDELLKNRK